MRKLSLIILLVTLLAAPALAGDLPARHRAASFTLPAQGAATLHVPYISNGAGGVYSSVRLFNSAANSTAHVDLTYYDANGQARLVQSIDIPARGSALYGPASYGSLPADFQGSLTITSSQPLAGLALYDTPDWAGDGLMACPALEATSLGAAIPGIQQSADAQTLLAIHNASQAATLVNISLWTADGNLAWRTPQVLPANGSIFASIGDLIAPGDTFQGTVQVSAGPALAVYALQRRPGQQLAECSPATEATALSLPNSVAIDYFLPQVTNTGDALAPNSPRWLAFNPSADAASSGQITYLDINGSPISEAHSVAARQTLEQPLSETALPAGWRGAALYQVDSAQAVRALGSDVISGTQPYLGSYAAAAGGTMAWLPAMQQAADLQITGLSVQNASDGNLNLRSRLYDSLGLLAADETDSVQRLGVKTYGPAGKLLADLPDTFRGGGVIESTNGRRLAVVAHLASAQVVVEPGCRRVDRNGDDQIGIADVQIFAAGWGAIMGQPGYLPALDLNDNGLVDLSDLILAAEWWGDSC